MSADATSVEQEHVRKVGATVDPIQDGCRRVVGYVWDLRAIDVDAHPDIWISASSILESVGSAGCQLPEHLDLEGGDVDVEHLPREYKLYTQTQRKIVRDKPQ